MNTLESELNTLKSSLLEMWFVVISQLENVQLALEKYDIELAGEVHAHEKLLDAFDLKHDTDCENIIAQYHPVEIDLRFVLAVLKINYNLERIGDYANYIANTVRKSEKPFDPSLLKITHIAEMFDIAHIMLVQAYESLKNDNIKPVRYFSVLDKKLDGWKKEATRVMSDYIVQNPDHATQIFDLFSIITKLERVGDHSINIAEEIIFYLNDRILKHNKLQKLNS